MGAVFCIDIKSVYLKSNSSQEAYRLNSLSAYCDKLPVLLQNL